MNRCKLVIVIGVVSLSLTTQGLAQLFKTQDQALAEVFADCDTIVRRVVFLTDAQVTRIENLARVKVDSKIVPYYEGTRADTSRGVVFFETNVVRTKPETFIVVVNPDASVRHIEVLAFYEPLDYLPTRNWYQLFSGRVLGDRLWPSRDIHNITGATLSVRAITQGVRKILAVYQIAIQGEFK